MTQQLPATSPRLLRRLNAAAVLRAIRTGGSVSRAELSRLTGLSKPTVNGAVELLLESGYLTERLADAGASTRRPGPRARLLSFRGDLGHVLGIDIGANKVLAIVADLTGEVLGTARRPTGAQERHSPESLLGLVDAATDEVLAAAGLDRTSLEAVGVGTPGVVDPVSGRVTLAPQLGGWEGIRLASRLEPVFPCSVLVDNEVHLSVLAERWRGSAQGIDDALYVQVGVGIGGGVLIGGDVYRGAGGRPARSATCRSSMTMQGGTGSGHSSTLPVEPRSPASAVARPQPARARRCWNSPGATPTRSTQRSCSRRRTAAMRPRSVFSTSFSTDWPVASPPQSRS